MYKRTEVFVVTIAAIAIWTILSTLFEMKSVPQSRNSTLIHNNFMVKVNQLDVIFKLNESQFERLLTTNNSQKGNTKKWKMQHIGRSWSKEKGFKKVLLWKTRNMFTSKYYQRNFPMTLNAKLDSILKGKCEESRCTFITKPTYQNQKRADAILFIMPNFLPNLRNMKFPKVRSHSQHWIFESYEPPANAVKGHRVPWDKLAGVFNRTMSYRRDADVVVRHGLIYPENKPFKGVNLPNWSTRFDNYTQYNFKSPTNKNKAPIIWFVSHCQTASRRATYVRKLQKYIGVDVFGRCGPHKCGKPKFIVNGKYKIGDDCFRKVQNNYKFYISFENDICCDYITEKAFNALQLDTIPIVMTGVNVSEVLPPHSILDALQYSPFQLAQKIYHLLQHPDQYLEYFSWRKNYSVVSHLSIPDPCDLCLKLHSQEWKRPKVYDNMEKWFIKESNCRSWYKK